MNKFEICCYGSYKDSVDYQKTVFPNGEIRIEFTSNDIRNTIRESEKIIISGSITKHSDIFELLFLHQILSRNNSNLELELVQHLYGRQDRNHRNLESSLGVKVFADMINSMNFKLVELYHPHSDVLPALINNCKSFMMDISEIIEKENITCFVFPDKGAQQNFKDYSKIYDKREICFEKTRDFKTGQITGMRISHGVVFDKEKYLILDDICDGGRTFIECAKIMKGESGKLPIKISLFVNYGIFSRGFDEIYESGIDSIYYTNLEGNIEKHKRNV